MWGKGIGLAFGFVFAKLPGALLGLAFGAWIDWKYGAQLKDRGGLGYLFAPHQKTDKKPDTASFFYALFATLGYVAKAKGRVSENDIAAAQSFMDELGLKRTPLIEAQNAYREGRTLGFPLQQILKQFKQDHFQQRAILNAFMLQAIDVVRRSGSLEQAEVQALKQVAKHLGFTNFEFERWLLQNRSTFHAQKKPSQATTKSHTSTERKTNNPRTAALALLEVPAQASLTEIKQAYRKKMRLYHPDRLVSQGLPPELKKQANQRAQAIQQAYQLLKNTF